MTIIYLECPFTKSAICFIIYTKMKSISQGYQSALPGVEERVMLMKQMYVKFNDVKQIRDFVNAINKVEAKFELGSGRRIVDPKSILGVFTLDLTQPQELRCDSDDLKSMDKIIPFLQREKLNCRRM